MASVSTTGILLLVILFLLVIFVITAYKLMYIPLSDALENLHTSATTQLTNTNAGFNVLTNSVALSFDTLIFGLGVSTVAVNAGITANAEVAKASIDGITAELPNVRIKLEALGAGIIETGAAIKTSIHDSYTSLNDSISNLPTSVRNEIADLTAGCCCVPDLGLPSTGSASIAF